MMTFLSDVLLGVTGTLAGAVAVLAWRNRPRDGTVPLAGLMAAVAVWSVSHVLAHHATGGLRLGLEKLDFAVLAPAAFLWFAFALEYTGRRDRLTRRTLALLFAWPTAIGVLVWLPASVQSPLAIWSGIDAERGLVFWGHVAISYGLLAAGTVLLLRHVRRSVDPFRKQGSAVLAGIATAWIGSAVSVFELFGIVHLHALPFGLALMGGFLLWAVVGAELTRVAPVARRTIVRRLDAGVVSIDEKRRVTSANPAARELFGLERPAVGRPVADVFGNHSAFSDWLRTSDPASGRQSATFDVDGTIVECELSPLRDDADRSVGGVLLLYDVTERRRRNEQLKRQTERLEQFGSVLSHDLRNPLNVALGRVELAREERDSDHLATAAEALDRMETLIEDLRTFARQGRAVESTERVRLSSLAARSWEVVETSDADLTVESDLAFDADPDRLARLFENLFRNSVEHGSTGSLPEADDSVEHEIAGVSVRVGVTGDDGFYVADDGPGIPEGNREEIFEAGYSTTADGTGLGLAIVAEVADAHDWEVRATESRSAGARFEITGIASARHPDARPEPAASAGSDRAGRVP